jgi:hypothetical protein
VDQISAAAGSQERDARHEHDEEGEEADPCGRHVDVEDHVARLDLEPEVLAGDREGGGEHADRRASDRSSCR